MKYILISTLITVFLLSCEKEEKFNTEIISKLEKYKEAQKALINHLAQIKVASGFHRDDSLPQIKQLKQRIILQSSREDFKKEISPISSELDGLLSLWDDGLLEKGAFLVVDNDSTVIFHTKQFDSKTSSICHYLVYDPNTANSRLERYTSEILHKMDLGNDWYYVIVEFSNELYI